MQGLLLFIDICYYFLIQDTKYTAFIPSNQAFAAIPKDKMDALLKDTTKLGEELLFHVLPGKLVLEQLKNNKLLKTMDAPQKLRINVLNGKKQVIISSRFSSLRKCGSI